MGFWGQALYQGLALSCVGGRLFFPGGGGAMIKGEMEFECRNQSPNMRKDDNLP